MIFPLKLVVLLVLIDSVSANCKNPLPKAVTCKHGGPLLDRLPIAENYYSGKMCILIYGNSGTLDYAFYMNLCQAEGGFLTAPQSDAEATFIIEDIRSWLHDEVNYFGNFTIAIDGKRKKECMTPDSLNAPPCSTDGAFKLTGPSANSMYIFSKWGPNQPSNSEFEGKMKECLGMDQDGLLRDIFCDGSTSPILVDNEPEYVLYGLYCGYWPEQEE